MNNLHKKKDVYELTRLNNLFTRNEINIPGFDDYRVLKCDFHTHTVFSDGLVWLMVASMRLAGRIRCDSYHGSY